MKYLSHFALLSCTLLSSCQWVSPVQEKQPSSVKTNYSSRPILSSGIPIKDSIGPISTGPKPGNQIGPVSTGPKPTKTLSPSTKKVLNYFHTLGKATQNPSPPSKTQVAFKQSPQASNSLKGLNLGIRVELQNGQTQAIFKGALSPSGEYIYSPEDIDEITHQLDGYEGEIVDIDFEIYENENQVLEFIENPWVPSCESEPIFLRVNDYQELYAEEEEFEDESNQPVAIVSGEVKLGQAMLTTPVEISPYTYYTPDGSIEYVNCLEDEDEKSHEDSEH